MSNGLVRAQSMNEGGGGGREQTDGPVRAPDQQPQFPIVCTIYAHLRSRPGVHLAGGRHWDARRRIIVNGSFSELLAPQCNCGHSGRGHSHGRTSRESI